MPPRSTSSPAVHGRRESCHSSCRRRWKPSRRSAPTCRTTARGRSIRSGLAGATNPAPPSLSISGRVVRRFYDTNNGETMFRSLAIAALVMTASAVQAQQPAPRVKPVRTGYVPANGVNYYYEIYGRGAPLLILHGGLGSIEMFGQILPALAKGRQVIAVDLLGHGRTALGDRPINPQAMGDDLAAVVKRLGQDTVDVLGYSLGGGVALRLAIQHPEVVRRLVLVSTPYAQDGFYPEMLPQQAQVGAAMAPMMKETPMYKSYLAVAPRPEDFPRLLDRVGEWMR